MATNPSDETASIDADTRQKTGDSTSSGPRPWHQSELTRQAQQILRGATPERGPVPDRKEILKLAKNLANNEKKFGYARKLVARARSMADQDEELGLELRQKHALYTYKDPDLPTDARLDLALEILQEDQVKGYLVKTDEQETLGLAGAIYKRKWQVDAQKENLERSLSYYLRGYEAGPEKDQGYTGINAAFVLDQLASLEATEAEQAGAESESAKERQEKAREIRTHLISVLLHLPEEKDDEGNDMKWLEGMWWYYATIAEAYFGLGEYDHALQWLQKGKNTIGAVPDWEIQSTADQLASLARLMQPKDTVEEFINSRAAEALTTFLGKDTTATLTAYIGKVGVALSGGGFRASLFHIGVLAKLAELDVLRRVEALSCVSGGSILGAHYYLELRRLLKLKKDEDITREDYIALVHKMQKDFLTGVQRNIRSRVVAEFITNLKMIFWPGYSRTMRVGDLYERELFSRVDDVGDRAAPPRWAPWRRYWRWLNDLYISPKGESSDFRPKNGNWRRRAKVPDLILNATTLNTGHNWQFTASWMGEPPGDIETDVDGNYRLRRMYYWEAPPKYQRIRLGHAVAASACVPGLFDPLSLDGLYPDRIVRLVDGGVHDNQGISSLLDQDCNVLLVSDASGQMNALDRPGGGFLSVLLRTSSISMSRVRTEQYDDLSARSRSNLLRGLMYIHLKQDLDVDPIDWIDCKDPHDASDYAQPAALRDERTRYGIRKDVQELLAGIRTDLDSFCDVEAYALMTSGYRMTEHAFENNDSLKALIGVHGQPIDWDFLEIEDAMEDAPQASQLGKLLQIARQGAFKIWSLWRPLKIVAGTLLLAILAGAVWLTILNWETELAIPLSIKSLVKLLGFFGLAIAVGAVVGRWAARLVRFRETLIKAVVAVVLAILGPVIVRLHLWVFDRLYLRWGKMDKMKKRS